jgi:hypothetical protein
MAKIDLENRSMASNLAEARYKTRTRFAFRLWLTWKLHRIIDWLT